MMLLAIFLLPLVAAAPLLVPSARNYILDVDDGVLNSVRLEGDAPIDLDLSGLGIRALDKNALINVSGLKSLSLANNTLETLPDFVFSNLTDLECLNLAENKLSSLNNQFVGLENLRELNISYNPIVKLRRGNFFGLTKNVTIFTEGNVFWVISNGVFTTSFLKDEDDPTTVEQTKQKEQHDDRMEGDKRVADAMERSTHGPPTLGGNDESAQSDDQKLKLCTVDNMVVSLAILEKDEILPEGCSKVVVNKKLSKLNLRGLGIKGFQEGWYQIQSLRIVSLDISRNEIEEITKEILNDLPAEITWVNLQENRIRAIWSEVIKNGNLKMLHLGDNLIEDIDDNAFKNTNLTGLLLPGNQLSNLNFTSTLPPTLMELVLTRNQITSIPDGLFTGLSRLYYLNLGRNKISTLQEHLFRGLHSLEALILTRNSLTEIDHKAFKDLKQLKFLYMYRNMLSEFKKGTFSDLDNLKDLQLGWNKFTRISKSTLGELPKSLDSLHLEFNEIEILEERSFVNVPRVSLSLNGNKISSIPQGTFDLPTLQELNLNNNTLATIDGDGYEGLPQLKRLWLSGNRISQIGKGSCKNLASLNILDISRNPFQRLENGALYGLTAARGNFLYINDNQLKEIQGGVFDDA